MNGWPLAAVLISCLIALVLVAVAAIYAVMPKSERPAPVTPDRSHWRSPPDIDLTQEEEASVGETPRYRGA